MERTAVVIAVAVCLVTGMSCQPVDDARAAVARGNNAFSSRLYKELAKDEGNVFFSPLSVETVLAMAWTGARGKTASQIAEGLSLPPTREQVEAGFKAIMTHLQSTNTDNITLDIANKIYAQKGFEILDDFHKSAEQNFLSESQEVDFAKNLEGARTTINQWVEQKTRNRIKDLLPRGSIDNSAVLVLVNAIYFKGKWLYPFDKENTDSKPFFKNSKTSSNVQMMHTTDYFNYAEIGELNAKVLQLQYSGNQLSLVVILPNDVEGLTDLESKMETFDLETATKSLTMRRVIVSLPKFKLERSMDLNEPLKKLGMTDMFGGGAEFSGLAKQSVKVSNVFQKSFVEVNEEGSEAAAATGLVAVPVSLPLLPPPPPPVFNADHPFIFLVKENSSGTVLFVGRFVEPQ